MYSHARGKRMSTSYSRSRSSTRNKLVVLHVKTFDIKSLAYPTAALKLMSSPLTLCVSAPNEMKSTPACA